MIAPVKSKVLTLNAGSSSLKYKLYDAADLTPVASGLVECIGNAENRTVHRWRGAEGAWREIKHVGITANHGEALNQVFIALAERSVLTGQDELTAIGHRVVHGGEHFTAPTFIDDAAFIALTELNHLAPLHNPANLEGIAIARRLCPKVPQIAVFDTSFHHTLPPKAFRYAIPEGWYNKHHVRRYGFHGMSVHSVARRAGELLNRPLSTLNLIVLHLGNGASATALSQGHSVDTSMGMTPLEGLAMGSRCGDIDAAVIFHLLRTEGHSADSVEQELFHHSGLIGLCGHNDLREIHRLAADGDEHAELALDLFCYRIKKYVGAYLAVLGKVDAIVFTAGIGEHDAQVRERSLGGLEHLGIVLDTARNSAHTEGASALHANDSRVAIWVIPTDEELEIARSAIEHVAMKGQR